VTFDDMFIAVSTGYRRVADADRQTDISCDGLVRAMHSITR